MTLWTPSTRPGASRPRPISMTTDRGNSARRVGAVIRRHQMPIVGRDCSPEARMRPDGVYPAAALCGALALVWLGVAGGAGGGPTGAGDDAGAERTKAPAVRHPGAATGQHGGVASPTVGVPHGSRATRAPVTRPGTQPGTRATVPADLTLDPMQRALLERVNYYRTVAGVPVVSPESNLLRAAQAHASYLGSTGQSGHFETERTDMYYTGRTPFDRLTAA